jgi:hypothetical protein
MSLTKLSLGGNNLYIMSLFPPKESLVSDIPTGDGKIENIFYGVELPHTKRITVYHYINISAFPTVIPELATLG